MHVTNSCNFGWVKTLFDRSICVVGTGVTLGDESGFLSTKRNVRIVLKKLDNKNT
jgi:hypothetical protein